MNEGIFDPVDKIEQLGDLKEIQSLSLQIKESAEQAAAYAQQLNDESLSAEARDQLAEKLKESVEQGSVLSEKRMRVWNKYPPLNG